MIPVTELPKTIMLKGNLEDAYEEGRAGGAITPGDQIMLNSAGALVVHGTAGGVGELLFAMEDALQGKTIDNAYASGDLVRYWKPKRGNEIYARLKAGEVVVIGDKLISGGDGTQIKATGTITGYTGIVREAVDNSAGGLVVRVKVRVV